MTFENIAMSSERRTPPIVPVACSDEMRKILQTAQRCAARDVTVLLTGESGTGKGVMARYIHEHSSRAERNFRTVVCSELSSALLESELFGHEKGAFTGADRRRIGRLESADTGTLFLDEVGEIAPETQVKLLRVLEKRPFERVGGNVSITIDVRLIVATNRDLEQLVTLGLFRKDLYYRIQGVAIDIPPLRSRQADILPLAERYLEQLGVNGAARKLLSREAQQCLLEFPWPGNARELSNVIARAVVMSQGDTIEPRDLELPETSPPVEPLCEPKDVAEALGKLSTNPDLFAVFRGIPRRSGASRAFKKVRDICRELGHHLKNETLDLSLVARVHREVALRLLNEQELPEKLRAKLIPSSNATPDEIIGIAAVMEEMRGLQGKIADPAMAARLAEQQRAALLGVLALAGSKPLRDLWDADLGALAEDGTFRQIHTLREYVIGALSCIYRFRSTMATAEHREVVITNGLQHLNAMSGRIRYDIWTADEALFSEYLLGLLYFEILVHVGANMRIEATVTLDAAHLGPVTNTRSYADGLDAIFLLHEHFIERVHGVYCRNRLDLVWVEIWSAWQHSERASPGFQEAVRHAVSMRQIPENQPQMVTLAQILHWDGWGGQGEILEMLADQVDVALLRVLHTHRSHAFNWHALHDHRNLAMDHFDGRRRHFQEAASPIAEYAAGCMASLLCHKALKRDPMSSPREELLTFRLWADAVGPTRVAEKRLFSKLARLSPSPCPEIRVVLTDISGPAVDTLLKQAKAPGEGVRRVIWRDLNLPFPGEPGSDDATVDPELARLIEPDRFDGYCCSIALHQIADRALGLGRLRAILAFATRIVRPGGVISLPDVGVGASLEAYLLPINMVDREGGWSCDTFFAPRSHRFMDVAYPLREHPADADGRAEASPDRRYKIPVPIFGLRFATPQNLDDRGSPIYEYTPCVVVDLSSDRLHRFDADWGEAPTRGARAELALRLLAERWPETRSIVDDVLNQVTLIGCGPTPPPNSHYGQYI